MQFTRVRSNNLSTQLMRTRTSSTVSPPVPTTVVADPEQTTDSEQIRMATIALHTEQEKHIICRKPTSLNGEHFHSSRVSYCGLTSISAIAATAFDESYKWPK